MTHIKNIVLICPYEDRIPLQVTSHRVYMPRYGMLAVATALNDAGYSVRCFCELSGSRVDWQAVREADAVLFSLMSFSSHKGYEYADRIRSHDTKIPIIFGGSHASVLPGDCLEHCDYVVRNEGEAAIVELLETLGRGGDVSDVKGVSWRSPESGFVHNESREFIDELDLVADPMLVEGYGPRSAAFYIRDTLRNGIPRFNMAVAQSSRGCPFGCRFCFVKQELGRKYRMKDPRLVLREIEYSVEKLNTRYVFFADNDVALDREHAMEVFRLIGERFGGDIDLFFFSRIFIARDEELMRTIEKAGRVCIGVGVESMEQRTLDIFDKGQDTGDIRECISLFGDYDVKIQLLFVFGSDGDGPGSVGKGLRLALDSGVYNWGFCSVYDFPTRQKVLGAGQSVADERFIHRDWRFYSGNFVVHYPLRIRPSELQAEMSGAYRAFYRENRNAFYQYHPIQATFRYYIPFLKEAEKGMYGADGMLREDMLPGPSADRRKIDIPFRRISLAGELARFYLGNITRPVSWKFLRSLVTMAGRNTGGGS